MSVSVLQQVQENLELEACILVRPTELCRKPFQILETLQLLTVGFLFLMFPVTFRVSLMTCTAVL